MKTLVVILCETRAHELTFNNIKSNLIDPLQADLCLCIGIRDGYDMKNPFYIHAKYKFLYPEPDDYSQALDTVYEIVGSPQPHWTKFLEFQEPFLGGASGQRGSGAILMFYRWFLLNNLNSIPKYDRYIITRSDYIFQIPHAPLELMDPSCIWIPDCEHYDGYTDRHAVLSNENLHVYLNILENMLKYSSEYFEEMSKIRRDWNIERLVKFHLEKNKVTVSEFPYVMYTVRSVNDSTSWSQGEYSSELEYYIKYPTEYDKSSHYKSLYDSTFYERYFSDCKKV